MAKVCIGIRTEITNALAVVRDTAALKRGRVAVALLLVPLFTADLIPATIRYAMFLAIARDYADQERRSAEVVRDAAAAAGVQRIVYLGGVAPTDTPPRNQA
mgnify:CR=1 FL=1